MLTSIGKQSGESVESVLTSTRPIAPSSSDDVAILNLLPVYGRRRHIRMFDHDIVDVKMRILKVTRRGQHRTRGEV